MPDAEESFRSRSDRTNEEDNLSGFLDEVYGRRPETTSVTDVPSHSQSGQTTERPRGVSSNDKALPDELVMDDPFAAASAKDGDDERPRLRTALPTDVPPNVPAKEAEDKKPADRPRVVLAVMAVPPEPPDVSEAQESGWKRPENKELSPAAEKRMQDLQKFSKWLGSNFSALDADNDGKISADEIGKQVAGGKLANGENAAQLAALYSYSSSIMDLQGDKSAGITKEGVARLEKLAADKEFFRKSDRPINVMALTKIFSHLDSGENPGRITPAEVDAALKRTDITKEQRQALEDLRGYQRHLLTKEYPNTTKQDGKEMIGKVGPGYVSYAPRETMGDLESYQIGRYASPKERLADGLSRAVTHANDRIAQAKANPDLISQGTDGSCFFIAPLASMRNLDAKAMDKLIKDNKDGTHTVTFPGDAANPITVKAPTDAELANWATSRNAAILEKAFAQHYVDKIVPTRIMDAEDAAKVKSPVPSARILGGRSEYAVQLLTGNSAETVLTEKKSEAELRAFLKDAADKKIPLVADTFTTKNPGLVNPHSYSARYDAASDSVILENPVKPARPNENTSTYPYEPFNIDGSPKDKKDDGVFKMSVAEFKQNFAHINHPVPGTKSDIPKALKEAMARKKKEIEDLDR